MVANRDEERRKEKEMDDKGSAITAEQGAACDVERMGEWFACWDIVEALARDADRLYAKCGSNCATAELSEWRERVLAQVRAALEDEERIFRVLNKLNENEEPVTSQALQSGAI
jgi:hypothetical protein